MRTDAMLFTMGGSMEKTASCRMDHIQNQLQKDSVMGFGKNDKQSSAVRFKETYEQIARSNKDARHSSIRNSSDHSKISKNREESKIDRNECIDSDNRIDTEHRPIQASKNPDDVNDYEKPDENDSCQSEQASELIKQSLVDISDFLQLNIAPGLDQVAFDSADSETVEQFAQIVHNLKNIIKALEVAVSQDQPIDTGKKVIEPQEAAEMITKLQAELFKIEIGINMLGKSEEVQNNLAAKLDIPFSSGIPQAIDPSELSMPVEQARKILKGIFDAEEDNSSIAQLAKKLNELVEENKPDISAVKIVPVTVEKQCAGVNTYDAQTFRAMLKIEAKEKVSTENADAAVKNGDLDSKEAANGVLARDVSAQQARPVEQVISVNELAARMPQNQNNVMQEIKSPLNINKALEQSVVNQITDKIHSAVRSGVTEVRIQLRPEALGEVTLKIRIEGDVVTARMQVENQQVKAIVESNLQNLKDALAQHNLQTGSLDVNVQNGGKDTDSGREFFNNQAHPEHQTASSKDALSSDSEDTDPVSSVETGRRFGNNSIEYFA